MFLCLYAMHFLVVKLIRMLFYHVAPRNYNDGPLALRRRAPTACLPVVAATQSTLPLAAADACPRSPPSHLPPDCSPAQKYAHAPTTTATLLLASANRGKNFGPSAEPWRYVTLLQSASLAHALNLSRFTRGVAQICRATVPLFLCPF